MIVATLKKNATKDLDWLIKSLSKKHSIISFSETQSTLAPYIKDVSVVLEFLCKKSTIDLFTVGLMLNEHNELVSCHIRNADLIIEKIEVDPGIIKLEHLGSDNVDYVEGLTLIRITAFVNLNKYKPKR